MILKKLFFFCTCLVLIVGCDTNSTKEHIIYANDFDVFKNTPVQKLSIAVENQDIQEIQKILNTKKINVDYQESRYGQTLLMLAAYHGLEKSVKELLKNGANPDLLDKEGVDNAFFISCEKNLYRCNTNIVKLMLANGAEINRIRKIGDKSSSTDSYVRTTPLMIAAADNCIETVRLLVQSGAKIDQYTYFEGYGAISEALIFDHLEIAKYLIIDCKAPLPKVCLKENEGNSKEKYLSIIDVLNGKPYEPNSKESKLRIEIIKYLEQVGYNR